MNADEQGRAIYKHRKDLFDRGQETLKVGENQCGVIIYRKLLSTVEDH
jgi:hypothetical protein